MNFETLKKTVSAHLESIEREARSLVEHCHSSGGAISAQTAVDHVDAVRTQARAVGSALAEHEEHLKSHKASEPAEQPAELPTRVSGGLQGASVRRSVVLG